MNNFFKLKKNETINQYGGTNKWCKLPKNAKLYYGSGGSYAIIAVLKDVAYKYLPVLIRPEDNKEKIVKQINNNKYEIEVIKELTNKIIKPKLSPHIIEYYDFHKCNDLIGKRIPNIKVGPNTEQYIDELNDYTNIKNKKIVCIDPGKSDILYCVDDDSKEANEFRYTQDSRRKECKIKKYAKIILEFKKEKVDGKTIIEYETELSKLNRKTLTIKDFKEYIKKKSEINNKLYKFYEKYIFRKLKLNGYMNRKKNEQKLMNNFKKIFGKPEETIIIFGDWEQKQHMKYKEPTKGKGMRMLFRQNKYKTYLIDEFRTSCMCSICKTEIGKCEKFQIRENPKPYKSGNILVHGLISCKNCFNVWNRDVNGATNICRIAKNAINGIERPKYLCREKKEENKKVENPKKDKSKKIVQKKVNKSVKVVALTKS